MTNPDETVPPLYSLAPSTASSRISVSLPGGWSLTSASLAPVASGFALLAGSTNVAVSADGSRHVVDANGIRRQANYWVDLDDQFQVRTTSLLVDYLHPPGDALSLATNCQDLHLFRCREQLWVAGQFLAPEGRIAREMVVGGVADGLLGSVNLVRFPVGYDPALCLPVSDSASEVIMFVTASGPTRILTLDTTTWQFAPIERRRQPHVARQFRRVTSPVTWEDGFLDLVADGSTSSHDQAGTNYRFVAYDRQFRIAAVTAPFVLDGMPLQSWMGLSVARDRIVLFHARHEWEHWATVISTREIMDLLEPLSESDLAPLPNPAARSGGERRSEAAAQQQSRPRVATKRRTAPELKIASTTMSGNSEDSIADALRSVVDWVDLCVLIDTGITDRTIDVAREIVGDKLVVRSFPWQDDFSAARNAALQFAHDTGADWSVTVDTDERIQLHGVDIRAHLSQTSESVLLIPHDSGEYTKDRFFRLPAIGQFRGATHEAFYRIDAVGGGTVLIPNANFAELPKTKETFQFKLERDRRVLLREIEREPAEPRWLFYLGDALQRLSLFEEAADAFRRCANLRGWEEESGWAMYRAAECLVALGKLDEALDACAIGMTRHAGLAELPWYAGYISLQRNRPEQAIHWARMSIVTGKFAGTGRNRIIEFAGKAIPGPLGGPIPPLALCAANRR